MRFFYGLAVCLVSYLLITCTPQPVKPESGAVLDTTQVIVYSNATLNQLTTSHDSLVYRPADYELRVYRLIYRTKLSDGRAIAASGVVYVPSQSGAPNQAYPLLSYQHPTAFSNAEAPSGANFTVPAFSYPIYFATHGYIVVCPDYIGYGQSDQVEHPYEHGPTLGQATVDMLVATKAFLSRKNIACTDQVFLTGYSEGGLASLSAQKIIDEHYANELRVAGSSCGAGPYVMSAFYEHITQQPTTGGIANYLYVWQTLAYNRLYGLNKPAGYYFKAPYADLFASTPANARTISLSFDKLCTDEFKADVRDPASAFGKVLAESALAGWKTTTPTRFIHGQQDEIIPFLTTQTAYDNLRRNGSPTVSLVTVRPGYHVPTEVIFMRRTLEWFGPLRQNKGN